MNKLKVSDVDQGRTLEEIAGTFELPGYFC